MYTASVTSSSASVWPIWVGSTSTTGGGVCWPVWYNATATTATMYNVIDSSDSSTTSTALWLRWASITAPYVAPQRTPEQERAHREVQARVTAERDRLDAANRAIRAEANRKARAILVETLNQGQRGSLEREGFFDVQVAGHGMMRIRPGRSHNVRRVDERGRERESYCAHPRALVPDHDTALAQKLMLEACPAEFFRLANRGPDPLAGR